MSKIFTIALSLTLVACNTSTNKPIERAKTGIPEPAAEQSFAFSTDSAESVMAMLDSVPEFESSDMKSNGLYLAGDFGVPEKVLFDGQVTSWDPYFYAGEIPAAGNLTKNYYYDVVYKLGLAEKKKDIVVKAKINSNGSLQSYNGSIQWAMATTRIHLREKGIGVDGYACSINFIDKKYANPGMTDPSKYSGDIRAYISIDRFNGIKKINGASRANVVGTKLLAISVKAASFDNNTFECAASGSMIWARFNDSPPFVVYDDPASNSKAISDIGDVEISQDVYSIGSFNLFNVRPGYPIAMNDITNVLVGTNPSKPDGASVDSIRSLANKKFNLVTTTRYAYISPVSGKGTVEFGDISTTKGTIKELCYGYNGNPVCRQNISFNISNGKILFGQSVLLKDGYGYAMLTGGSVLTNGTDQAYMYKHYVGENGYYTGVSSSLVKP